VCKKRNFYITVSTVYFDGETMSHSLTKIWIHLVFGTKDRMPLIKESFEKKLYEHIKQIIETDFKSLLYVINGTADHIHILILQNQNYSIADIAKNLKGNSSHWINENGFTNLKFAWQTGYGAFSVSESMIEDVKKYIQNQKEHHRKISFAEEYKKFEEKYGFLNGNR
jgi:putative transposase